MAGRGRGVGEDKTGCPDCNFTGYSGRTAVAESLDVTPDLGSMISLGMKGEQAVEFAVNSYGMLTLAEAASRKLLRGETSFAEVEQWLTAPPKKRAHERRAAGGRGCTHSTASEGGEEHTEENVIEAEYETVEEAAEVSRI